MNLNLRILGAALALALAATPAAAVVKIATYTGTIFAGNDITGVFGVAGQDLAGVSYLTTYTYDRTLGGSRSSNGASPDRSSGGSRYGNGSPIIDSTVTINGITQHVAGSYFGFLELVASPVGGQPMLGMESQYFSDNQSNIVENKIFNYAFTFTGSTFLDENVASTIVRGPGGTIGFFVYNGLTGVTSQSMGADLSGDQAVYSVSDAIGGAVPEPAAWVMMIAGVGFVGAALRRRRTAVTTLIG